MIAQLCGAPVWLQVMIAAVVTLVLLLATRPLVKKFLQNKETHTNADRVVGQTAVVTEDIDNLAAHGAWKCSATTGQHAAQKMSVFKKAQRCRWCVLRA
mgnify:CR=1 FL=1